LPFVSVGTDPELYTRSMQYAAFSAQLRPHAGKTVGLTAPGDGPPDTRFDRRAWEFPYEFFGPMREAMQLRSRLLPYTYSAALRAWLRCDETKRAPALFVVKFLIRNRKQKGVYTTTSYRDDHERNTEPKSGVSCGVRSPERPFIRAVYVDFPSDPLTVTLSQRKSGQYMFGDR
jgi:hypothetical protein